MRKHNELHLNIGAASIILVMLVFALCTFATLSIKASNNEYKLAKKTAQAVKEYYQAEREAFLQLEKYTPEDGRIDLVVDINDSSWLVINAEKSLDGGIFIHKWKMMNDAGDLSEYDGNEDGVIIDEGVWDGSLE